MPESLNECRNPHLKPPVSVRVLHRMSNFTRLSNFMVRPSIGHLRPDLTVAGTGIRISVQSPVLTQVEYTPLPRDMPGTEEPG